MSSTPTRILLVLVTIAAIVCVGVVKQVGILDHVAATIAATIQLGVFAPLQPVNLAVTIGDQHADLSWSPPLSHGGVAITDYVLEYKLSTGGVWVVYSDGASSDTTATITGLSNDTSYDFRVYAVNPIGQGPASAVVSGTPGSPAQVLISAFSDVIVPTISANTRITNEGSGAYEYQYMWCVTDADTNVCGGGDDIGYGTAAKLIQAGEHWDTILSATVETSGIYWFHVSVQFGSDTSYASQSFTATSPSSESSGGVGGGSSSSRPRQCIGADFNRDRIVNLVDFSILLSYFGLRPPFTHPCVDINQDGRVDMSDFSILLTQWNLKPTPFAKQKTP